MGGLGRPKLGTFAAGVAALLFVGLAVDSLVSLLATPWGQGLMASDVAKGYLPGAARWIEGGSPYLPGQVAGPWALSDYGPHAFIHPPSALPLFALFLVLPLPLWWAVPIGVTLAALVRLRPAPWSWPLMAACLAWPRSTGALVAGNSDMWAMAAVATGAAWGWPVVLLAIKPTFAPLALVAIGSRSAWVAGALFGAAMLPLLPLWIDWAHTVVNANLGPAYSLLNLPLVVIGGIAWIARRAPASSGRTRSTGPSRTGPCASA